MISWNLQTCLLQTQSLQPQSMQTQMLQTRLLQTLSLNPRYHKTCFCLFYSRVHKPSADILSYLTLEVTAIHDNYNFFVLGSVIANPVVANLVIANLVVADWTVANPVFANSVSQIFCESGNPREFT